MKAATELRRQIESALADRIPAAFSFRPPMAPELLSCGLAEVDAVLGGGLPLGAITELTGDHSSGRTTLALAALAEVTRQGESCAYVDVSDALNPISASALGVDLRRLLWIRAGEAGAAKDVAGASSPFVSATSLSLATPAQAHEARAKFETNAGMGSGSGSGPGDGVGWRHPRDEAVGLHRAVGELFHAPHQRFNTPNQLLNTPDRERVDFTPRCSEAMRRERVRPVIWVPVSNDLKPNDSKPIDLKPIANRQQEPRPSDINMSMRRGTSMNVTSWTRLDHGLRATDLLLSTGGFRALVLDMGDVSPEQARRVPLATWYRFRLQVEKSHTLFLLLTRVPCANSCAAVSLHCSQGAIHWQHAETNSPSLLAGLGYRVSVERSRTVDPNRKKPAASAETAWSSTTSWSRPWSIPWSR
jgi:recombination protein RecA